MKRLRHKIMMLRYKLVPTDRLIERIAEPGKLGAGHTLIDVLKERLAHQDGSLEGVDWSGIALNDVLLSSCRLARAKFCGAELRGAYFGYSNLVSANFAKADLREAHFREAQLRGANFTGANLRGANFARADLQGVSFAEADLTDANFWGADLQNARLTDCNLPAAVAEVITALQAENSDVSQRLDIGKAPQD